jgi:hypothetical protein
MAEQDDKSRAKDIVALRNREKARQSNFRSMWQSVSDLIFPQTMGIAHKRTPGEELMTELFDITAVEESENMTSGLVNNLFPAGQRFFAIVPTGRSEDYTASRYVDLLTEIAHEAIFKSNFLPQVSNTIQYWLTFGIGNLFTQWLVPEGLNYRDYAIGTYQCLENSAGVIDTVILTYPLTARQIVQEFSEGTPDAQDVGQSVKTAYDNPESREESFDIIHVVRPRKEFDEDPFLRPANRMPIESIYVQEKDEMILREGGFDEFPFSIPRYQVIYGEVYGRGRGTQLLPQVRMLNRLKKDYQEMVNKWVNPPKEVLESFEGNVDVTPGALNYVVEPNSIQPINMGANGVFPVTKDILEYERETIRQGFFKNAFEPITPLRGDRRNQMEIIERLREGMKKASKPLGRLFTELVTPAVLRSVLLLIRNGQAPPPPPQLQGTPLKIELINPLALALRDQQSRGFQYWVAMGQAMAQSFPSVIDNIAVDEGFRDYGRSLGVKTTHIRPESERDEMRVARAQQEAAAQKAAYAEQAAKAYAAATQAPESGSPAEMMLGGV